VADAEDLVHEAVLRALRASAAPRALADLRPWMFRIVRNLHLDALRRDRTRREYSADRARFSHEASGGEARRLNDLLVRQAFERLAENQREVLYLVDIMGLRYAEAAVILQVPQGTVMSRLSRARRALIAAMDETTVRPFRRRERG
jgi:RNA polymerase sigma-70 factor (ECF subfamily)